MLVVSVTVTAGNNANTALTTNVNAKNATGTGTTSMTINQALTSAPLFFVRSGYVGNYYNGSSWTSDYSKLEYPGSNAYYWSRSSIDSTYARFLYINDSNVRPSYYTYRYIGVSLRCLYVPGSIKATILQCLCVC